MEETPTTTPGADQSAEECTMAELCQAVWSLSRRFDERFGAGPPSDACSASDEPLTRDGPGDLRLAGKTPEDLLLTMIYDVVDGTPDPVAGIRCATGTTCDEARELLAWAGLDPEADEPLQGEPRDLRPGKEWTWTTGFGCRRLSVATAFLAAVWEPSDWEPSGANPPGWKWRVFTRPDVTGVGELVGCEASSEAAEEAARTAAVEHWRKNPEALAALLRMDLAAAGATEVLA